jgi:hypothetical protein
MRCLGGGSKRALESRPSAAAGGTGIEVAVTCGAVAATTFTKGPSEAEEACTLVTGVVSRMASLRSRGRVVMPEGGSASAALASAEGTGASAGTLTTLLHFGQRTGLPTCSGFAFSA